MRQTRCLLNDTALAFQSKTILADRFLTMAYESLFATLSIAPGLVGWDEIA